MNRRCVIGLLILTAALAACNQSAVSAQTPVATLGLAYLGTGTPGPAYSSASSGNRTSPTPPDCTDGWTQLQIGGYALVTGGEGDPPVRVRSGPGSANPIVAQVYPGIILKVVEGPVCSDGLVFWRFENASLPDGTGWAAEGDLVDRYLAPYAYRPGSGGWVSYTYEKTPGSSDSYHSFVLHFPQEWLLDVATSPANSGGGVFLTLKQGEFEIRIAQDAGDRGMCIYPGDTASGLSFDPYGEYKQLEKGNGILWRRARPENGGPHPDGMYFVVCELAPGREYATPYTSIGRIDLSGPTTDDAILNEFDQILARIEILK